MSRPPPVRRKIVALRTQNPPSEQSYDRRESHRRLPLTPVTVPARFREQLRRAESVCGFHRLPPVSMKQSPPPLDTGLARHPESAHRFSVPAQFLVQWHTAAGSRALVHPSPPHEGVP